MGWTLTTLTFSLLPCLSTHKESSFCPISSTKWAWRLYPPPQVLCTWWESIHSKHWEPRQRQNSLSYFDYWQRGLKSMLSLYYVVHFPVVNMWWFCILICEVKCHTTIHHILYCKLHEGEINSGFLLPHTVFGKRKHWNICSQIKQASNIRSS